MILVAKIYFLSWSTQKYNIMAYFFVNNSNTFYQGFDNLSSILV